MSKFGVFWGSNHVRYSDIVRYSDVKEDIIELPMVLLLRLFEAPGVEPGVPGSET